MKVAIDLLWVKPKKSGGIEAYIRNLLDGLLELEDKNEYVLILAKDNETTFAKYLDDNRFKKIICNISSSKVAKRILWQNIFLNKILKKNSIKICFEPIYSKPIFFSKHIKYITTIHDLQALHYPQYFSKLKYYWMKYSWKQTIKTSEKIIAISNFVKDDIIDKYDVDSKKIDVIYNPIVIDNEFEDFKNVAKKFDIKNNEYYYTVAQLLPHKNLDTIIKVIEEVKLRKLNIPVRLLISGVNGKSKDELLKIINEKNLASEVILTGFISNSERNTLYKNCRAFLFPSIFEGFGMPPIEAMMLGTNVITTRCTSLYEVTQGKAMYIEDPYNIDEWINTMLIVPNKINNNLNYCVYEKSFIAQKYLRSIYKVMEKNNEG